MTPDKIEEIVEEFRKSFTMPHPTIVYGPFHRQFKAKTTPKYVEDWLLTTLTQRDQDLMSEVVEIADFLDTNQPEHFEAWKFVNDKIAKLEAQTIIKLSK